MAPPPTASNLYALPAAHPLRAMLAAAALSASAAGAPQLWLLCGPLDAASAADAITSGASAPALVPTRAPPGDGSPDFSLLPVDADFAPVHDAPAPARRPARAAASTLADGSKRKRSAAALFRECAKNASALARIEADGVPDGVPDARARVRAKRARMLARAESPPPRGHTRTRPRAEKRRRGSDDDDASSSYDEAAEAALASDPSDPVVGGSDYESDGDDGDGDGDDGDSDADDAPEMGACVASIDLARDARAAAPSQRELGELDELVRANARDGAWESSEGARLLAAYIKPLLAACGVGNGNEEHEQLKRDIVAALASGSVSLVPAPLHRARCGMCNLVRQCDYTLSLCYEDADGDEVRDSFSVGTAHCKKRAASLTDLFALLNEFSDACREKRGAWRASPADYARYAAARGALQEAAAADRR